ncbi:MAG: TauD/TfdA family dioxygenase [Novosphingobium sp.]|nr:TauD/TfdA family dioxygenase [Novosphingobium sp.]
MSDAGNGLSVSYQTPSGLTVKRLQPEIGAEITGVDLCEPISGDVGSDIRQALVDHGVVFFRRQPLGYAQHLALARVFGEPHVEGFLPDRPEIMPLVSDAANTNPAGGHWHSDGTYYDVAPAVSILLCHQAAELGGDTCFASAAAVYAGLPDELKRQIAPLRARASMSHIRTVKGLDDDSATYIGRTGDDVDRGWAEHPVVRIHPETGKPVLYVNEVHTQEIVGMEPEESAALLQSLTDRFLRAEYQMRWSWRDHDITIWDNRQVQHYAVANEAGPRHVERIMVQGTPSVGLNETLAMETAE